MRIRYLLLPTLVLILTGCTHQRPVTLAENDHVARINERATERAATVVLVDGGNHTARALQVAADSTSWLVPETGDVMSVATSDVVEVRFRDRGKGALEGVGLGALIGGLLGVVIGFAAGDDPPCEGLCIFQMSAEEKALAFGVGFGLVGGLAGLVNGAIGGSKEVYRFGALAEEAASGETSVASSPADPVYRHLTDEERARMLERLDALQEALRSEPGTEGLQRKVAEAEVRAREGRLLRQELPRLVDLLRRYGID